MPSSCQAYCTCGLKKSATARALAAACVGLGVAMGVVGVLDTLVLPRHA